MSVLTSKNELSFVTDLDWFHVVDVSDTASSPQGTSKKIRRGNILAGYTGFDSRYYTETEVNNFFSGTAPIVGYNRADWDNAFSWGDHSTEGYLTGETDPIFIASQAFNITAQNITDLGNLSGINTGDQDLTPYQLLSEKGAINGYVPLNGSGLIPSQYLPSYVDDVLEFAGLASFPVSGESGKLYIALDTNFTYRWSGSTYVLIGSGGDADTLDGLDSTQFLRSDQSDTFMGILTVEGDIEVQSGNHIGLQPTGNSFLLRTDARTINGGSLHQFKNNAGVAEAWRESWWDGDSYVTAYAQSNSFVFDAPVLIRSSSTVSNPANSNASASLSWLNDVPRIRVGGNGAGSSSAFEIQGSGDYVRASFFGNGDLKIGRQLRMDNVNSYILRENISNTGMMVGHYSQMVSANYTNPIFCLGTSFRPNNTTLGNMYGIGYTSSSAPFINSTDLGRNPSPSGWGMYVASDGNARIFLESDNGRAYFRSNVYALNFVLNSDRRKKKNIRDVPDQGIAVRWRKFDTKKKWGDEKDRYGVVAQELESTNPEFVDSDNEGNLTVRYIDLLCAKMAEKDAQINKLIDRMEKLEKNAST